MSDLCRLIWCALIGLFRSRAALEAEILVLRHQLNVLRRKSPKRLAFGNVDRLVFAGLYRVAPGVLDALKILKPQTVIRWHRAGFRAYWRWKSRPRGGRPKTLADIRQLIRDMSVANPLWGAPRIHGELLKLGIHVGQTTVAKYMARRRQPSDVDRRPRDGAPSCVIVWIGEIQWMRKNGFDVSRKPILKPLKNIACTDALLNAEGNEQEWPQSDAIIGNPPFLGGRKLKPELGQAYVQQLRSV
jgi:hypothetical protein